MLLLNYFQGDYKPIGGSSAGAFARTFQAGGPTGVNLYNGNISSGTGAISGIGNGQTAGYSYRYDQLNRLKEMRQQAVSGTGWNSSGAGEAYKESITYDGNGNILTYLRNGSSSQTAMDNLSYGYTKDTEGRLVSNRLRHVKDGIGAGNYSEDLDDQADDNYGYDAIGNLVRDNQAGITNIDWSVYGKIRSITKGSNISYSYDPSGNRVSKTTGGVTTYYARDAQGNVISVYDNQKRHYKFKLVMP